jgi:hypothetical protein
VQIVGWLAQSHKLSAQYGQRFVARASMANDFVVLGQSMANDL